MVRYTSKAPRPPEAEWTSGVAGEEDETLDGFVAFSAAAPVVFVRTSEQRF
jgi:hypothetical protein